MKIDNITINLYDEESGDDCQIHLGYDSNWFLCYSVLYDFTCVIIL